MPIKIYSINDPKKELAWLCENSWNLPEQLDSLETWLNSVELKVAPGNYVTDIGFSVRKDASGGGGTFSTKAMKKMSELGIELWFSEYQG